MRLINPRVAKDALHGLQDVYRIKITTEVGVKLPA
jgi:hypothetical protein